MYSIYIIHDKRKVGLTKNLKERVEKQQGYKEGEYEVFVDGLKDLQTARDIEKQVQKHFGYTEDDSVPDIVDQTLKKLKFRNQPCGEFYTKAIKDVTVGFPAPIQEFGEWVQGCKVTLDSPKFGKLVFDTDEKRKWLTDNVKASKYNSPERATYIYLKAAYEYLKDDTTYGKSSNLDTLIDNIHSWADSRGILDGKIETQTLKLGEEFGELQKAVLKDDKHEIKDAIGDIIVVLTSIAHFNGHSVADAVQLAYDTISKRTGYTNDKGDFIKTHYDGKEINDTL